jgi:pyruvate-ferredoxin/flavodoxin oxidoreductase
MPVREFAASEARFAILSRTHPERSERLLELMQNDVDERWRYYEQLAAISRTVASDGLEQADERPGGDRSDEEGKR